MRLGAIVAVVAVGVALAAPTGASASRWRHCMQPGFASGELVTKGVSCRGAARIVKRALAHPGCTPTARQRASFRGCYGSTRVGRWRCHGLFPGEGFDLYCRSGKRRIHGGAGG